MPAVALSAQQKHLAVPMRITYVDGPRLRASLLAAGEYARSRRAELNRINVFPVPDGDTGTNLALTLEAMSDALRRAHHPEVSEVAREAAHSAVLGARGNSGMMLSHFLMGFADRLTGRTRVGAEGLSEAIRAGAERLEDAVERPVEGTIVSVVRDTARAAADAPTTDLGSFLEVVVGRARESLARTPDQLPALRKAGVVDAGAKGFGHLLEGAELFVRGDPSVAVRAPWAEEWGMGAGSGLGAGDRGAAGSADGRRGNGGRARETSGRGEDEASGTLAAAEADFGIERYRYCTEALVRGGELPSQTEAQRRLRGWGDSLIVIRTGDALKVHVHTDDPDEVFGLLRGMGRLVTHKAEDLRAQHRTVERAAERHVSLARRPVGVVTDSGCDLPDEVVRAHGIRIVPLQLADSERTYRDREDIGAEDFVRRMERAEELPTTSQPAPGTFLEALREAAEDSETLVAVLLASGLSGTFAAAESVSDLVEETPVAVVDSKGVSLLQGLLTLKAAELAEAGTPPPEIAPELERIRARSGFLFVLDRFDRLLASGRIGRGTARLGSLLGVKPILRIDGEGKIARSGFVLGRKRVLPGVMKRLESAIPEEARPRFGVVHVGRPEVVEVVSSALRARWGEDVEILSGPATPVIATHAGLGAWAVAYLVE